MKKYLSLLLVLVMVFALCACASSKIDSEGPNGSAAEEAAAPETTLNTVILKEADDSMINNYTLMAVNPDAPFVDADGNAVSDVQLNTVGAAALINWLLSEEGEAAAAEYGFAEYGEYLFYLKEDRPVSEAEIPEATEETKLIRLSTTTSVNDSGLLDYLLPMFEEQYGYEVEVFSAGTGKAIANAKMGNADLILVHAKAQEEAFVEEGFAYVLDGMESERMTYMYNYFVLCGPKDDPAGDWAFKTGGRSLSKKSQAMLLPLQVCCCKSCRRRCRRRVSLGVFNGHFLHFVSEGVVCLKRIIKFIFRLLKLKLKHFVIIFHLADS